MTIPTQRSPTPFSRLASGPIALDSAGVAAAQTFAALAPRQNRARASSAHAATAQAFRPCAVPCSRPCACGTLPFAFAGARQAVLRQVLAPSLLARACLTWRLLVLLKMKGFLGFVLQYAKHHPPLSASYL